MDLDNVSRRNKDTYVVKVQFDEEQFENKETNHTTEEVGYKVFSQ